MALLIGNDRGFGNDFEIEKSLVWKTEIPFENKVRQSSYFSLLGLEWCLRFSFTETNMYHVITLHQVIDGQVSRAPTHRPVNIRKWSVQVRAPTDSYQRFLEKGFSIKTFLMHPTSLGSEKGLRCVNAVYPTTTLWFAGYEKNDIYKSLPSLYDRCEVKVVCRFYGQPLSTFQLQLKKGNTIHITSKQCTSANKSVQVSSEVPQDFQTLSREFSDLLEKKILPDVKLVCEGQTFQAHRCVLAARSEVFWAMFQNKMLERKTGVVKIVDMDVAVLQQLLKFIYSGKPDDLSEDNIADLYEAADKYDVVSLKEACSYWMVRNLTERNCIHFLQVASSHSDPDLKTAVTSFIIKYQTAMMSESWLSLSKELPLLTNEVFQAYITSTVCIQIS